VAKLLSPGTVLRERYRITGLIGQGGMGAVYVADDLRLEGRKTAIKEVRAELVGPVDEPLREQARAQFHREASILARLDHPNLPKVSDYFCQNGRDYLVMDFVPGPDLLQLVEEARVAGRFLDEAQVLQWASQIVEALRYLHNQRPPILHRDIKPSNIKLTPEGRIKLVDFGLVKVLISDDSRTLTVLQGRGTVAYTPIEQYGGDTGHTDVRSDIYALGATLYHLLTGHPPADAKQRFLDPKALVPPRQLNPAISPHVERAVLWAMEMHPENRPATVDELWDALQGRQAGLQLYGEGAQAVSSLNAWGEAVRANWPLLWLSLSVLSAAVWLTWRVAAG